MSLDSSMENGSYKFHNRAKKEKICHYYNSHGVTPTIKRYDVVPIFNYAFSQVSSIAD